MDLSEKHFLTEKEISFPVLERWSVCGIEDVVDTAEEDLGIPRAE
jgi:hypothetical protein